MARLRATARTPTGVGREAPLWRAISDAVEAARDHGQPLATLGTCLCAGTPEVSEAQDRLVTWIDLNAPCHGTWSEVAGVPGDQRRRRLELRRLGWEVLTVFECALKLGAETRTARRLSRYLEATRRK